jgi:hypothetical protein
LKKPNDSRIKFIHAGIMSPEPAERSPEGRRRHASG